MSLWYAYALNRDAGVVSDYLAVLRGRGGGAAEWRAAYADEAGWCGMTERDRIIATLSIPELVTWYGIAGSLPHGIGYALRAAVLALVERTRGERIEREREMRKAA